MNNIMNNITLKLAQAILQTPPTPREYNSAVTQHLYYTCPFCQSHNNQPHTPQCITHDANKIIQQSTTPLKFGLDIHGVIDKHPNTYSSLSHSLTNNGHEVHVITGIKHELCKQQLIDLNISYTHFFSIHEHFLQQPNVQIQYDELNRPIINPELWDKAKAQYCKQHNITMHFDDSPHYGHHFDDNNIYLQQYNNTRDNWRK